MLRLSILSDFKFYRWTQSNRITKIGCVRELLVYIYFIYFALLEVTICVMWQTFSSATIKKWYFMPYLGVTSSMHSEHHTKTTMSLHLCFIVISTDMWSNILLFTCTFRLHFVLLMFCCCCHWLFMINYMTPFPHSSCLDEFNI